MKKEKQYFCTHCGQPIGRNSKVCIKCGYAQKKKNTPVIIIAAAAAFVVLLASVWTIGSGNTGNPSSDISGDTRISASSEQESLQSQEPSETPEADSVSASAPTPSPTIAPTPTPITAPTPFSTIAPTPEPTIAPTPSPTIAPTPEPTIAPTPTPTIAPTPEPTIAPAPIPALTAINGHSADMTVYVSRNGKIHSVSDCSGMKYYTEMTLGDADSRGYVYCKNCW